MHPQSGTTKGVLILCMIILGILLLPLPFTAYKILKFFLSLFLLYTAGFFLWPRKNLMFTPSNDRVEVGTRNPRDGAFTGKLTVSTTYADVADLTEENSQLVRFLDNAHFLCDRKSLPPISLKVSLGLVVAAVVMNPLTRVHMPRALGTSLFITVMIYQFVGAVANKDVAEIAKREQVPGEFSITVIALIYIAFALGGHFTAVPEEERTGPAFNDWYDP